MSAPRKESKTAHFSSYGELVQRLLPSVAEMGFFLADGRRIPAEMVVIALMKK